MLLSEGARAEGLLQWIEHLQACVGLRRSQAHAT